MLTRMYRRATLPKGGCPRCYAPLRPGTFDGHDLQVCEACGGLFLDNALSRSAIEGLDRALARFAFERDSKHAGPPIRDTMTLQCPTCARDLERTHVAAALCAVDACAQHGTWFDTGELLAVSRALRSTNPRAYARMAQAPEFTLGRRPAGAAQTAQETPFEAVARLLTAAIRGLFDAH
jgi:Zn-finger nucleic acid-binding protein